MTEGKTFTVTEQLNSEEDWDALQEVTAELEQVEARIEELEAELAIAVEALRFAHDTLGEINPSNYDHDDVCNLNDKSVEVIIALSATLAELKGQDDV